MADTRPAARDEAPPIVRWLRRLVRDDSLSLALFGLFLVCAVGQSVTGWRAYRGALREAGLPGVSFGAYLHTGTFLDGAFSNWQAAILQLAVLVAFSAVLRQRGAAHSRKPQGAPPPPSHRTLQWKYRARDTLGGWLYANSLSLVLFALFAAVFALHAVCGRMALEEERALRHLPAHAAGAYVASSDFWFTLFQTWEAEFLAIAAYIVLSIVLRQEGSPESKPVGASDRQTGGPNE